MNSKLGAVIINSSIPQMTKQLAVQSVEKYGILWGKKGFPN